MMNTTQEQAMAVTAVFWDIKTCPVPPGYDARQVGPRIKRCLENLGYNGPLTIFAVGRLTDVPVDVLRAVSSTGIVLYHVPYEHKDFVSQLSRWALRNPPPANIVVISDLKLLADYLGMLRYQVGYNVVQPFPHEAASTSTECLLKCYLLSRGLDEDDKCCETGDQSAACWVCFVCLNKRGDGLAGQGFENFITHLSTQEHSQQMSLWLPGKIKLLPASPEQAALYEHPFDCPPGWKFTPAVVAGTCPPMIIRYLGPPETLGKDYEGASDAPYYSHSWNATPTMMSNWEHEQGGAGTVAEADAPLDSHLQNATTMVREQPE